MVQIKIIYDAIINFVTTLINKFDTLTLLGSLSGCLQSE